MPFLAPIVGVLTGAGDLIGSIAGAGSGEGGGGGGGGAGLLGAINDGINAAKGPALLVLAQITAKIESQLKKSFDDAFGLFDKATSNLFAGLGAAITGALAAIGNIISKLLIYIKQFLDPILKLLNEFAALFDIIRRTYQAINTMVEVLHADIHGGILGILSIPKTLSDGLTAVEAQTTRAIQILSDQNKSNISDVLIPGMSKSIGDPLQQIHGSVSNPDLRKYSLTEAIKQIRLTECAASENLEQYTQQAQALFDKLPDMVQGFAHMIWTILTIIPFVAESISQQLKCVGQLAAKGNPSSLLGLEDVVEGVYRGELSDEQAQEEALRQGFTPERLNVLMETARWLPDVSLSLQLYHRGAITRDELSAVLKKARLTEDDISAVDEAFLEPVEPREMMAWLARLDAKNAGLLATTLGSVPPNDVVDSYRPRFQAPSRAYADWTLHWKIPELDWWLTAFVRGFVSLDDVKNAAIAENIPGELFDRLVPVWQDKVPVFHLADLLGGGIIQGEEARKYLRSTGLDDQSVEYMLKLGELKNKAPFAALGATLAGVSEQNARKMYDDKIIDVAVYQEILEAHGLTPEAAQLTVELSKQENMIAERKTFATGLVDEVNAGQITLEQLVSTLFGQGFTKPEVDAYALKVKQAKVSRAKQLSEAQLTDLFRHAIIDQKTFTDKLEGLGYFAADAQLLLTLEIALHGNPSQPGPVS